jgi:hypothetical protein
MPLSVLIHLCGTTRYITVLCHNSIKLPAHLNCLLRRGKRQEARGNSKGIGGDSANLKNKRFKCVLA